MFYNTQNDPRWRDHTMAHPDDTLGKFGCLVTTLANILEITPDELNHFLKTHNGYLGLLEPVPVEYRSRLIWEPVLKYFYLKRSVILPGMLTDYSLDCGYWLIGKYELYPEVPHFVNIIGINEKSIRYFNVANRQEELREHALWINLTMLSKVKPS